MSISADSRVRLSVCRLDKSGGEAELIAVLGNDGPVLTVMQPANTRGAEARNPSFIKDGMFNFHAIRFALATGVTEEASSRQRWVPAVSVVTPCATGE